MQIKGRQRNNLDIVAEIVAVLVLFNGVLFIATTLIQDLILHNAYRSTPFSVDIYILIGITLIYFSSLLIRRKQTAWVVVLAVYAFYVGVSITQLHFRYHYYINHPTSLRTFRDVLLPLLIVIGLTISRQSFNVKSDIRSFGTSLRVILIVFLVAFIYGVAGFQLMDKSDFHAEIGFTSAVRATAEQFNITTSNQQPFYTRRARLFEDSLDAIAVAAVGYALLSLFQPLKARLVDQEYNRRLTSDLLDKGSGTSEDFFKLWPHDKDYFFNEHKTAGLAYKVHRGIALVVGDPFGAVAEFKSLLVNFSEFCRINDWQPSFIHTEDHYNPLYKNQGYSLQKIGEEAIVNVKHFEDVVIKTKYFRNINNKFEKNGYTVDVLKPPHDRQTIQKLKLISDDWLKIPGRSERGFMMGYFTPAYMQMCDIVVLKDKDGVIKAFINQIHSFDRDEANYDLLRHTRDSLGNSGDYILTQFIKYARREGFKRVNLGLCPLVGLDKDDKNRGLIDNALSFLYANGDKILFV